MTFLQYLVERDRKKARKRFEKEMAELRKQSEQRQNQQKTILKRTLGS